MVAIRTRFIHASPVHFSISIIDYVYYELHTIYILYNCEGNHLEDKAWSSNALLQFSLLV